MNVEIDPKYAKRLEALANASGRSIDEVVEEIIGKGLASAIEPEAVPEWKPKLLRALDAMRELPVAYPDDDFSGADHDDVLYPKTP
jgi:hypothetical protein